jgi:hypothetical protein
LVGNIYFELTEAFNAEGPAVALASGQAVVFYRVAIMSKDGDWIIRETARACERVLRELERRGARYRPSAPLDIRWLAGGWSSHFEFFDDRRRRIRCDFLSRPPRVPKATVEKCFTGTSATERLRAIDIESLILMKRTQRAKDYAVIAELARRLPPEHEIELTTDPDRIMALATTVGRTSARPCVRAALTGAGRRPVVVALAEEADEWQRLDRRRVEAYERAARPFLKACRELAIADSVLGDAHDRLCTLAEQWLPMRIPEGQTDANAE